MNHYSDGDYPFLSAILFSLKRTPDRTDYAVKNLINYGIPFTVIWATDGSDSDVYRTLARDPIQDEYMMQKGEVGICDSYYRACSMIIRYNMPWAMIVEDDATLHGSVDDLRFAIADLIKKNKDIPDIIFLREQNWPEPELHDDGHTEYFDHVKKASYNTCCIIVSNAGARKLIGHIPPYRKPIDVLIRENQINLNVFQPKPGKGWFMQNNWFPSTCRYNHNSGNIPKILHRVWVGNKEIPEEYEAYWESWKKFHPGFETMHWDDRLVQEKFPRWYKLLGEVPTPAGKSDFIRLLALYEFGGLYVDCDFECFHSFEKPLEAGSLMLTYMHPGTPCNGLIGATQKNPVIKEMIKESWKRFKEGRPILEAAGPAMIKDMIDPIKENTLIKELRDGDRLVAHTYSDTGLVITEPWVCFPYYWTQERPEKISGSWAAHHWGRSWWTDEDWRNFHENNPHLLKKEYTAPVVKIRRRNEVL